MYRTEISVIFDDRSHLLSLNTYLYPPPHARETRIQQELLSPVGLYLSHVNFTRPSVLVTENSSPGGPVTTDV